jgi:hypothetical protein
LTSRLVGTRESRVKSETEAFWTIKRMRATFRLESFDGLKTNVNICAAVALVHRILYLHLQFLSWNLRFLRESHFVCRTASPHYDGLIWAPSSYAYNIVATIRRSNNAPVNHTGPAISAFTFLYSLWLRYQSKFQRWVGDLYTPRTDPTGQRAAVCQKLKMSKSKSKQRRPMISFCIDLIHKLPHHWGNDLNSARGQVHFCGDTTPCPLFIPICFYISTKSSLIGTMRMMNLQNSD